MKTVLFACVHNAGRSQMAAAFFNMLVNREKARALSGGTQPGDRVHPEVVTAMNEASVDLSGATTTRSRPSSRSRDDWPLIDPKGKPIEQVRAIRDDVRSRVETLIDRKGWR